jgi:hypothetical protein
MNKLTQLTYATARTLYPRPTILFSETPDPAEAVVFVANHEKNYGPAMMQLFFPLAYRPWVINSMLEMDTCRAYIQREFFETRWKIPATISHWIAGWIETPLVALMQSTRPVPVYRGMPNRIVQTFNESIDTLVRMENLLIFPENGDLPAYSERVKDFHTGFIYLGKLYHRKTGRRLAFCPVAINPHQHTITIGEKVTFNPEAEYVKEQDRIRLHLLNQIDLCYELPWTAQRKALGSPEYQAPDVRVGSITPS